MGRRNKYVKDYETRIKEGGDGEEVVYTGKYYRMNVSDEKRKKVGISYLAIQVAYVVAFLLMGMLDTDGSRKVYIVLPYMFLFLPIYYGLLGTLKLLRAKSEMVFAEYDQSILRIKKSTTGMMILSLAVAVGEVFYLVSNKITSLNSLEYKFLMGTLFFVVISFLFLQLQSKYECVEVSK